MVDYGRLWSIWSRDKITRPKFAKSPCFVVKRLFSYKNGKFNEILGKCDENPQIVAVRLLQCVFQTINPYLASIAPTWPYLTILAEIWPNLGLLCVFCGLILSTFIVTGPLSGNLQGSLVFEKMEKMSTERAKMVF